ncbi:4-hydroxy-tetrahydrodipicolinate synthase [Clostridium cellulovorans]|uniref:4-hydroxy-tetrahydrodipicolinate synthase n=1 Tax=Clostridium cellulovorans (strain ATCC 35296 / DSM 3052 / OCM 3 / 743B) TaxID=573061 RepID=D9SLZ4_CLOC7|nr:4-hydroxy-tetrahydrodipicolinate synthase [Clostridium cellulovorans]ADL51725.1 dihydrodipicolinate synthase [Clostridium cellulovorans 743B]
MSIFNGSAVAIITPFTENGVDYNKLEELIEFHITNNTDAIVVCGTTGEASTMTTNERKSTIKFVIDKVNKRIPVIAGTGTNNTQASIEMSQYAESVGADALLVITPYYNKTSSKGLVAHFKAVAQSVKTPIMLYNVPSRTNMIITTSHLSELKDIPNIVAIKEANDKFDQIAEIFAQYGDRFDIYSGNDNQVIPLLSLGGKGVVSVIANILPKEMHDLCTLYTSGNCKEAVKIQLDMIQLIKALFVEPNPIPIKTAMNLLGYNVGNLRLPLTDMEDKNLQLLKTALVDYGFKL